MRDRLNLAFNNEETKVLKDQIEWMKGVGGFTVEWVNNAEARRLEPQVSGEITGALYQQSPGALEPYRFILAAMRAAEHYGVEMLQRRAIGLISDGDRVTGVTLESGNHRCRNRRTSHGPVDRTGIGVVWSGYSGHSAERTDP